MTSELYEIKVVYNFKKRKELYIRMITVPRVGEVLEVDTPEYPEFDQKTSLKILRVNYRNINRYEDGSHSIELTCEEF